MSSLINSNNLHDEIRVVWLEDPVPLDYVRQMLEKTPRRRNKPRWERGGRMVGYAELTDTAAADPDSGVFRRRVFFLLPHDRDSQPDGLYRDGAPGEAIDPRTVAPGRAGEKTPRSQHRAPQDVALPPSDPVEHTADANARGCGP
ncbi:DUF6009 family protein [Streptomyces sp. NPDC013178]|uniref:DUF6009 family protein n=1 Tax=Streptomyces sp. NPDC013178 TaxID=3155118 RepID=UPI0033E3FE59